MGTTSLSTLASLLVQTRHVPDMKLRCGCIGMPGAATRSSRYASGCDNDVWAAVVPGVASVFLAKRFKTVTTDRRPPILAGGFESKDCFSTRLPAEWTWLLSKLLSHATEGVLPVLP